MKQPELGKKIAELRKAKGLTQEELVEMCNVSVRTIQRIETGEVEPRSYTVKTILAALDYNLDLLSDDENEPVQPASGWSGKPMMIDEDVLLTSEVLTKQLTIAWIFGICYFIMSFLEAAVEYARFMEDAMMLGTTAYVVLKLVMLASFIFFQRGFIVIGEIFDNYLLKIISVLLIGATVLFIGYDIVSVFYDSIGREYVLAGAALLFGVIGVVYGVSLARLEESLGSVSKFAGIFEIIAACFFLTVALAFIGDILHVPAELLQIILLFKAIQVIKTKKAAYSFA